MGSLNAEDLGAFACVPNIPVRLSELFAMGPVPRRVAENSCAKPGFWEHFVDSSKEEKQKQSSLNSLQSRPRKFTKSDLLRLAPI